MFDFEIILPPGFTAQAEAGVRKELSSAINKRLSARVGSIRKEIGNMLATRFNNTAVARALRGQSSTDLPAHFGLSDANASNLASDMEDVIRKSVRVISALGVTAGAIKIQAVDKDYAEFLNLPNASYLSTSQRGGAASTIEIPVMRWMLIDPNIDIGQAEYEIVFSAGGGNAALFRYSRSGRAIMRKLKQGGTGYVLPDIVRGALGENFLEYTLRQPEVATAAAKIFIQRMQ